MIVDEGERLRIAEGRSGAEFFAFDTVRKMFRDDRISPRTPQLFLDKGLTDGPILDYLVDGNLNLTWPETHDRLRPILMRGFKPRRIKDARVQMRSLAEHLLDDLGSQGSLNFVTEFSHHLSIGVIAQFIGIPLEDVHEFDQATVKLRLLGQEPFWPGVAALDDALRTVRNYSDEIVAKRRKNPQSDFISDLIAARDSSENISEAELVWNIAGILLAGHDTTRYQLSSTVRAVVEAGHWETLVRDPSLIPAAINEAMRLYPATPRQVKIVQQPLTLEGTDFHAGDVVTLNISAAGRDPDAFPDPDRFKLDRPTPGFDIGFGYGAHYCLGFAVAKAEMEEGVAALTQRWSDVTIAGPVEVHASGVIAGPEVVPIRYRTRVR